MSEQNKAIVRRFYEEVMGQGKVDLLDEIMAENFTDNGETSVRKSQRSRYPQAGYRRNPQSSSRSRRPAA